MKQLFCVILAAGKGTRMRSHNKEFNKVLYPILGKPIVKYVVDSVKNLEPDDIVVVAGYGYENTAKTLENDAKIVKQEEILGTGNAVLQALPILNNREGNTIILYGDTPLIRSETLVELVLKHERENAALTILTSVMADAQGYNKIIREQKTEKILKINDVKEARGDEYSLTEIDGGVYVFDNQLLFKYLPLLKPDNEHGELSLITLAELLVNDGHKVEAYITSERQEIFSINDRFQLAYASKVMRKRVNRIHMLNGVSIEDPDNTYISPDVRIGSDTIIGPNTSIIGRCFIGENNFIGTNTYIENTNIGSNNKILKSHIVDSSIKDNNNIGPFARLRNGSVVEGQSLIGNFVELNDTKLDKGVQCGHLIYLSKATVGKNTNVGCGTITSNYDGHIEMEVEIGEGSFLGSGTILVSPAKIAPNSFTAAGSTITKDVKEGEVAFARSEQNNVPGLAEKYLKKVKKVD